MTQFNLATNRDGSYKSGYFKDDDFGAFDQKGLIIDAVGIPEGFVISKAELRVGPVVEIYDQEPIFPIEWTPDAETTELLDYANECYLAVYDAEGRKKTCQGHFTLIVREKEV